MAGLQAGGNAAGTGSDRKENAEAAAAIREQAIRRVLSSGIINSVKAHLRAQLYAELKGPAVGSAPSAGGAWPAGQLGAAQTPAPSLAAHVLNCLVAEFLLARRHTYSLSVFLAESGSASLPRMPRADILRLVGVVPESKVHALLASSGGSVEGGGDGAAGHAEAEADCLAERIVAALGELGGRVTTSATACQTDAGWDGCGVDAGDVALVLPASQHLAARLAAVEEDYGQKAAALEAAASASLEERLAGYQRECDARCAAQLAEQLAALRAGELAAVREEEASRHAAALAAERATMTAAHQERLARLNAQEEDLLERARRLHREQDQLREEHLRRMRADEERLQAWKAHSEAKLAAREAAVKRQQEASEAAARADEATAANGERRLAARLAEAAAVQSAAECSRAAAEAGVAHVAGLQRQLASALEELGALRQQLSASRAAHRAEVAALQQEAQALRQEKERLEVAAAATAAAPGLSPNDSARLQQAVRRLMRRVEQMQGEVEAGREREQLLRSCAGAAEKLVAKGAKAQDRVLRHAEELRLALGAAAREVGDLADAAALAAAGTAGPPAAALAAAGHDAQRWRECAEGRVQAARMAEEGMRRDAAQLQQAAVANRSAAAAGLQQLLGAMVQGRQGMLQPAPHSGDSSSAEETLPAPAALAPPPVPAATSPPLWGGQLNAAVQAQQVQRLEKKQAPQQLAPLARQTQAVQQHAAEAQQQQQQQQQPLPAAPAPAAATHSFSNSVYQPQQPAATLPAHTARGDAPKPPSRTASDILAAYRARQQQQRLSAGSGAGQPPSRRSSLSPETSASREVSSSEEASAAAGGAATAAASVGGAATAAAPDADGYYAYVSDFTSEDSGRF